MSELPGSIWKRPFRGALKTFIWLLLLVMGSGLVIGTVALLTDSSAGPGKVMLVAFMVSVPLAGLIFALLLFVRWVRCWRNLRRLLFGIACLLTLLALAYAEENWRGYHAWNKFRQEWEARGEKFTVAALVPPPVPEEKNFALAPLLKPALDYTQGPTGIIWHDTNGVARLNSIRDEFILKLWNTSALAGNVGKGTFADLAACRESYRGDTSFPQLGASSTAAEDVLVALGKSSLMLDELRAAAATRPLARFPIRYDTEPSFGILLPHLSYVKGLTELANVRATAQLEGCRSTDAFEDLKLGLRLSDSIHGEPILISHLVRVATLGMDLQTVREGLVRHGWSDAQLVELESSLASLNLLGEYRLAIRGECAFDLEGIDYQRRHPNPSLFVDIDAGGSDDFNAPGSIFGSPLGLRLNPSGWFYQNMLTVSRMHQEFLVAAVDERARRVQPEAGENGERALEKLHSGPYTFFARLLLPAMAKLVLRPAQMQTYADAARVGCALERYRRAIGNLPDTLAPLVPRFIAGIPNDVIDGKPLRYRRNPDDSYVLYSIGWNQTDDGGQIVWANPKKPGIGSVDASKGDWVWLMPASLPHP